MLWLRLLRGRSLRPFGAFLSFKVHFANIARGVIDTRDVIFYLTVIGSSLAAATLSLQARTWK